MPTNLNRHIDASAPGRLFDLQRRIHGEGIDDMMRTFNMGLGLVIVTAPDRAEQLMEELAARGGRDARVVGEIVAGEAPSVTYVNLP